MKVSVPEGPSWLVPVSLSAAIWSVPPLITVPPV